MKKDLFSSLFFLLLLCYFFFFSSGSYLTFFYLLSSAVRELATAGCLVRLSIISALQGLIEAEIPEKFQIEVLALVISASKDQVCPCSVCVLTLSQTIYYALYFFLGFFSNALMSLISFIMSGDRWNLNHFYYFLNLFLYLKMLVILWDTSKVSLCTLSFICLISFFLCVLYRLLMYAYVLLRLLAQH